MPPPRAKNAVENRAPRTAVQAPGRDQKVVRNSLLAGSVAGMSSTLALYPLDVIRTKMQSAALLDHQHRGPIRTLIHTLKHGGIRALYTGISMPFMAQAIYKGTVFCVNNKMQHLLVDFKTLERQKMGISREQATLSMYDWFLCGFVAGGVNALFFVTPVEFVRSQLIMQHSKMASGLQVAYKKGTIDVIRDSVRQHGPFSLWRGASLSVSRDAIGCGCFFYTMAFCQKALTEEGRPVTFTTNVLAGGLSGLAFWISALPLDTIKTRVQSQDLSVNINTRDSIARIYHQGGYAELIRQLFRGWQVAYGRGIPSAAVTISVYSFVYGRLTGTHGI